MIVQGSSKHSVGESGKQRIGYNSPESELLRYENIGGFAFLRYLTSLIYFGWLADNVLEDASYSNSHGSYWEDSYTPYPKGFVVTLTQE